MYRFKFKPQIDLRVVAIVIFFSRAAIVNILSILGIDKPLLAVLVTGTAYIFLILSMLFYQKTIIIDGVILIIATCLFFYTTLDKYPQYYYLYFGSEYDIFDKVFNSYSMIFSYYFIRALSDLSKMEKIFKYIAIVTFIGTFWNYQGMAVDSGTTYSMLYGYTMSFCAIIFVWIFLNHPQKIHYMFLSILSIVLSAVLGSRGPLLGYLMFLILYFLIVDRPLVTVKKIFFFFFSILGILIIQSKDLIYSFYLFLKDLGFDSRTILKLAEGTITEGNGRENIYFSMKQGIDSLNLFDSFGAYGDRFLLNGRFYAHSIYYEVIITFGKIFGGLLIVLMLSIFTFALVRGKRDKILQSLLVSIICFSIGRLWISNSFWYEQYFGVALGLSVSIIKYLRPEKIEDRIK